MPNALSSLPSPLPDTLALYSVPKTAEGFLLAEIATQTNAPLIHVSSSDRELEILAATLAYFAPDKEVLKLPAWDCLPYDRSPPNAAIIAERLATLSRLTGINGKDAPILLTTAASIVQKLPPRAVIAGCSLTVRTGEQIGHDALIRFLVGNGYKRLGKAMDAGEFSIRGDIFDIVVAGYEQGFRLDFFGDRVEAIRLFDPLTQVSSGTCGHFSIQPMSEILLSSETISRFRERYREYFGAITKDDPLYESVSEGRYFQGMEHWLPLFYDRLETLHDYVPNARFILPHDMAQLLEERDGLTKDYYEARIAAKANVIAGSIPYNPLPPELLYLSSETFTRTAAHSRTITLSPFANPEAESDSKRTAGLQVSRNFSDARALKDTSLYDVFREYVTLKRGQGKSVMLACYSKGSADRVQAMLSEHGLHAVQVENAAAFKNVSGKSVGITVLALEQGFETEHFVIVSEQDLLGERIIRISKKKKKSEAFLIEAASFVEGELIVHKEHGIGRFEGLITLEVNGNAHDCLKLVYADDDKLFLPVENIDIIARYGTEDETSKLDKLGAGSWQARKAKLKERITLAAEELMKTAAERALKPGEMLASPHGLYEEFCARFPYMETEDQARSIDEVAQDLLSGKPMDRLICGDVGFGKTEVALRAAFIATHAPEGKVQVAVIAPTTLLVRQHYKTFSERFKGLPVTVRQLSRLVGSKEAKDTHEKLKTGAVDIVIGTHTLLSKEIGFNRLGLLIIDEEQHFGVAQKEKLKALKSDVHVLTLSATPIPRTLQLALSGVRELSLITTPPVDRLAVRSFVMPFDPVVIREALMREYHRGGRSFCVVPRIKDIAEMKETLSQLVPEMKLCVAHGQLAAGDLDRIMNEFYDGKYDILLSTAIIESGIDIPIANTIIIHKADKFGLSQLYQLRGRVGRSKTRAYAYFTLPHHKQLTKQATRRLEVMQTLDSLGAGFSLASHDMDIRGFGNLVGEEQSGHVREVGIELYQQMLEEAVEAAKHRQKNEVVEVADTQWSPQINLGMSVLIPEAYVPDLQLRLGLYRRVAGLISEEEIQSFAAEMVDRFGTLPEEVEHLLAVLRIKLLCREAGVERVDAGPKGAVLTFRKNRFANPDRLIAYISTNTQKVKLRGDQKLVFMQEWNSDPEKIRGVNASLTEIARLAA